MGLGSDLIGVGILLFFALSIYMQKTGKGLGDIIREIKGGLKDD